MYNTHKNILTPPLSPSLSQFKIIRMTMVTYPLVPYFFQVHTDDETNNPFRFRGLPHPPPSLCLPLSFEPHQAKWPHSNCSTFQPMIRMGAAGEYYSYAYSAVYETIDDDDDEDESNKNGAESLENHPMMGHTSRDLTTRELTSSFQPMSNLPCGCSPFQHLHRNHDRSSGPESFSPQESFAVRSDTAQVLQPVGIGRQFSEQCSCHPDVVISNLQAEAETEFNGSEGGRSCATCSQKSDEPQSGIQRHRDASERNDRSSMGEKQEIEKSSDYCSDVSCMSVGSISSSRNGAVGSPSSLSGYTNDFSYTNGFRGTDCSAVSSRLGHVGSANPEDTSRDKVHQTGTSNTADENIRSAKLVISSPSAFHPPPCGAQGHNQFEPDTSSEIPKENNIHLRDQVLNRDTRCCGIPKSLTSNMRNEILTKSSKNHTCDVNVNQSHQYQQHLQHHSHLIKHPAHTCQHRQSYHPHHPHHQNKILCHRLPNHSSKKTCLSRPAAELPCKNEREAKETRQVTPYSMAYPNMIAQPHEMLQTNKNAFQYPNSDALLSCNLNDTTSPIPRPKSLKSLNGCESQNLHSKYKTVEHNDKQPFSFSNPSTCGTRSISTSYTSPDNELMANQDLNPKTDDAVHDSGSMKKSALALHSQYFEKSSPA